MSIFGKIMGAIFGSHPAAAAPAGSAPSGSPPAGAAPGGSASSSPPAAAPPATVDVAAVVDKAAAAHKGEKLEWRTSIVDLMKALDVDSSLAARKDLFRHELSTEHAVEEVAARRFSIAGETFVFRQIRLSSRAARFVDPIHHGGREVQRRRYLPIERTRNSHGNSSI